MKRCPNCGREQDDAVVQCDCKYVFPEPSQDTTKYNKYEKFGGWLLVFNIMNWVNLVVYSICIIIFGLAILFSKTTPELIKYNLLMIGSAGLVVFLILMVQIIRTRKEETIEKVKKYIVYYYLINFVLTAIIIVIEVMTKSGGIAYNVGSLIGSVIWPFVWIRYFTVSQRVNYYYAHRKVGKGGILDT